LKQFLLHLGIATVLLPLLIAFTSSPETEKSICNLGAHRLLESSSFEEARKALKASREDALKSGDLSLAATCAFHLGLIAQLEAKTQVEDTQRERRSTLLLEAQTWYESLSPLSYSPGVVENLGHVYADIGQREKADSLFLKALSKAKGDPATDLRRSYADLLVEQHRFREAAEQYRRVLQDEPTDGPTWDTFLGMLVKNLPEDLPGAVWDAVDKNQTLAAQRYAFLSLSTHSKSSVKRTSLLAAIVAALSRQHYPPKTFAEGSVGKELLELQADPELGEGARLVLAAHSGTHLEAKSYGWWANQNIPYKRSPLEAFRSLLRSLAARSEEGGIGSAREFLELADQISKTPDLPLYVEVAGMYEAVGDQHSLSNRLQRWEPEIGRMKDQMNLSLLTQYHLAMSEAVNRLGIKVAPGKVDSKEYHLAEAGDAARRSKNEELLTLVYEAESRLLPQGGGGGGFGHRTGIVTASMDCDGGPGVCALFEVEVPELFQRPEDLRTGITRWARVIRGCEPPHIMDWRLERVYREERTSAFRLARSTRIVEAESSPAVRGLRQARPSETVPHREKSSWEAELMPPPAWINDGAWLGSASFVVVDVLRNALLRYGIDGRLRSATENFAGNGTQKRLPKRVRTSAAGLLVLELGANHTLVWLDQDGEPVRETELVNRQGQEGKLAGVLDWTIVGEDTILVVGNILHSDGTWVSALIRTSFASKSFEVVKKWSAEDPSGVYYRLGQPYLATLGEKAYFLEIGEMLTLYEVSATAKVSSLRRIASVPGGITRIAKQGLARFQTPTGAADLYSLIEGLDVPAGLYAEDGLLFLLRRPDSVNSGDHSWRLEEIEPRLGALRRTITLPVSAHHLTVIPGAAQWALIQRGIVERIGKQSISSAVFIPPPSSTEGSRGRSAGGE
jgi:tetratricopeptide (TPR) repeat protein